MGEGWVKYLLKGCVQAHNDLGIYRKPGMLDVEVVAIKWGCGRMHGKSPFSGELTLMSADGEGALH